MKRTAFDAVLVGVLLLLLYLLWSGGPNALLNALARFLSALQAHLNDLLNKALASKPFAGREFGFPNPVSSPVSGSGDKETPITGDADVYAGTAVGAGDGDYSQLWGV